MTLNFYAHTSVDYTWKVNDVGKSRLVIFPSDPDFVVGTYMIGVFSVVPARFEIVADISGGAYSSESVRNVERLTAKFNAVAEGFVKVQTKKPKPKSKVKLPRKSPQTAKERAEAFAEEQANAERRLKEIRKSVGQKVRKINKVRARHIARLEKELERSKRERNSLLSSFNIKPAAESSSDMDEFVSDDDDDANDDAEIEIEPEKVDDGVKASGNSMNQEAVEGSTGGEMNSINNSAEDSAQQNVSEILRALQDEESASSDDDTDEDESAIAVPSALLASSVAPLQMWRPLSKARAPPHNTFVIDSKKISTAKLQRYELTKRKR